jgi:hypothetical protein
MSHNLAWENFSELSFRSGTSRAEENKLPLAIWTGGEKQN